uniref:Regucalcin-like protein n=1 Tax=Galeruca daurica TaxID=1651263 RepID=A0A7G9ACD2_9CUCU|nr:regucalcin-like protein [Galeruca daurica]
MLSCIRPTVPHLWGAMRGQNLGTINKFAVHRNILATSVRHYSEDSGDGVKIVKLTSRIQHGEGPYWDLESNALVYTDTFKATLYKLKTDKEGMSPECFKLPNHDSVGFALRIKGKKDTWVVCGDRFMYELNWPDKGKVTFKQIHMIEKDKPKNQFNDGKADTLGRIWGGLVSTVLCCYLNNGGIFYCCPVMLCALLHV